MKRLFDIIFSLIGLILLFPLMIILCFSIKIFSNTPVLFIQERVGLNEKIFLLYKFCTMNKENKDKISLLTVEHNPRITKIGKI